MSDEQTPPLTPPPAGQGDRTAGSGLPPPLRRGEGAGGRGLRFAASVAFVVLLAAVGLWYALRNREPGDDRGRLQGEWSVAVAGREGVATVRVDGDRWTFSAGVRDGLTYRLTLRPERSPKELDLVQLGPDGEPVRNTHGRTDLAVGLHGVYAFDSDTLTVAQAPMTDRRPKALDDPDAQVLTMTRPTK